MLREHTEHFSFPEDTMGHRIQITTTSDEYEAFAYLAGLQMRTPADQLRWLLREELLRRGLIEHPSEFLDGETKQAGRDTD